VTTPYRGMGFLRSPREVLARATPYRRDRAAAVPESVRMASANDVFRDQGWGSSCTGFGVRHGYRKFVEVHYGLMGYDPSALALYFFGREIDGIEMNDGGAYIPSVFDGAAFRGVPEEVDFPYPDDPKRIVETKALGLIEAINLPPEPEVFRQAFDQRWPTGAWRPIHEVGSSRVDAIREALAAKKPVVLGVYVDDGFQEYRGGVWDFKGPSLGAHCMCADGYDLESLDVMNSWGPDWGERGRCRIGYETVASWSFLEAIVIDAPPRPTEVSR
jgi:hypothetical protein